MLTRLHGRRPVLIAGAAALTLVIAALVAIRGPAGHHITAYFTAAVGVHPGSDVRVLGVKVGRIDAVHPEGTQVRTTLTVDHGVDVPAGVQAVVVSPSVVSDRYVQLTPAYTGGPRLAGGAVIPAERTATPVELDQLYAGVKKLSTELGPGGVNRNGALSNVLRTGAANLQGNGQALGATIERFGQAAKTLSGSRADLFATIDNLQKFTTMIKDNDGQVRQAEQQLADVTGFLADDRENLAAALDRLAAALGQVQGFVHDNRALLKSNVDKLSAITQVLVDQRRSLAEALDVQPLNVGNVLNSYDPATRTLMGRGNLNELSMGGALTAGRNAPPLPLPAVGTVYGSPPAGQGTGR
ncbi:MCE family protein [Actinomadura scrupuli]|uniref:MCE family protein n=1 Tax=Actinomadura scrupuli TaxID=559629 RepID=UPI003D988F8E